MAGGERNERAAMGKARYFRHRRPLAVCLPACCLLACLLARCLLACLPARLSALCCRRRRRPGRKHTLAHWIARTLANTHTDTHIERHRAGGPRAQARNPTYVQWERRHHYGPESGSGRRRRRQARLLPMRQSAAAPMESLRTHNPDRSHSRSFALRSHLEVQGGAQCRESADGGGRRGRWDRILERAGKATWPLLGGSGRINAARRSDRKRPSARGANPRPRRTRRRRCALRSRPDPACRASHYARNAPSAQATAPRLIALAWRLHCVRLVCLVQCTQCAINSMCIAVARSVRQSLCRGTRPQWDCNAIVALTLQPICYQRDPGPGSRSCCSI